ncbi:FadR/GntR family transcriptional regulator [Streptomyces gilvus]|uniref:FadR/GntR family transcriptional regulator n=1 Tax=Streptomyces gilvus TaxID=2920937 RepID=UPI001F0D377C|nr:FCD domain-containing protein [Streptomyces sp. CME 23]MCH5675649.1 FCD domain-containing protein [Streptomyces sp. CME 23]
MVAEERQTGRSRARAAQLARLIESDIADAGWPVGEVLGSETDLRERYGVSREVLREAIRLVEHHEVAAMRRGPAGGLVVTAPAAGPAVRAMAVYLEYLGATVDDLVAARLLLEPLAARLAAEHLTAEGLAVLEAWGRDGRPSSGGRCAEDGLHLLLPSLGRNPALALFVDVLVALTGPLIHRCGALEPDAATAHEAIRQAVLAGEGGRAEYLSAEHLLAIQDLLRDAAQRRIDRTASTPLWTVLRARPERKLAEKVAHRLIEEITDSRAPAGTLVGSEADLASRIDVSKAVLREALRIVEYHSVARMRMGPGGGLVVTEPEPTPILETMAIYLDYKAVTASDIVAVRTVLELGCVTAVVERRAEKEVAERLTAAAEVSPSAERSRAGFFTRDLHAELAELSGSPILALFNGIVRHLWSRHVDVGNDEQVPAQESTESAHHDVVSAILAGNGPLARILMREHIESLPFLEHRDQRGA